MENLKTKEPLLIIEDDLLKKFGIKFSREIFQVPNQKVPFFIIKLYDKYIINNIHNFFAIVNKDEVIYFYQCKNLKKEIEKNSPKLKFDETKLKLLK